MVFTYICEVHPPKKGVSRSKILQLYHMGINGPAVWIIRPLCNLWIYCAGFYNKPKAGFCGYFPQKTRNFSRTRPLTGLSYITMPLEYRPAVLQLFQRFKVLPPADRGLITKNIGSLSICSISSFHW